MEAYKLTQEMKRHVVLIALAAHHSDLETATFLVVAKSFVYKVGTQLMCCGSGVVSVVKRKRHCQRSNIIRT